MRRARVRLRSVDAASADVRVSISDCGMLASLNADTMSAKKSRPCALARAAAVFIRDSSTASSAASLAFAFSWESSIYCSYLLVELN